jgi:hypothetical protein
MSTMTSLCVASPRKRVRSAHGLLSRQIRGRATTNLSCARRCYLIGSAGAETVWSGIVWVVLSPCCRFLSFPRAVSHYHYNPASQDLELNPESH